MIETRRKKPWNFQGVAPKKITPQQAHSRLFGGSKVSNTTTSTKGLKEVHLYMKVGPVAPMKKVEKQKNPWDQINNM